MAAEPDITAVAAALAVPARTAMCEALMDDRARTASELARIAGVSPATASGHLAVLRSTGMVTVVSQGRHRYHRIAGPDQAAVLEAIARVAPPRQATGLEPVRTAGALATARSPYDHIAGRLGVTLLDALLAAGAITRTAAGSPGSGRRPPGPPSASIPRESPTPHARSLANAWTQPNAACTWRAGSGRPC